jgi:hypothetical protein
VRRPAEAVRLYSSWRGLFFAFVTPAMVLAVAALAMVGVGLHALPIILLVAGVGLLVVSLFDFPIHTTFDSDGIRRRTPLRMHTIRWENVTAINRARGGRMSKRVGPLAAAVGGRRYLLVDRAEGIDEYEALRVLCASDDVATPISATAPDAEVAPTWLYHRRHS